MQMINLQHTAQISDKTVQILKYCAGSYPINQQKNLDFQTVFTPQGKYKQLPFFHQLKRS